jgi:F-type H+-transporting ATPase subunit b
MSELIITWQGLLFETAAFLIFTYLLNIFLFKPLREIIKKRSEIIGLSNQNKKQFEEFTDKLIKEAETEKNKLRIEINKIKETFNKEAFEEERLIIAAAKNDASLKFDNIIKDFGDEKKAIVDYYKYTSVDLANLICKKILD